MAYYCIIAMNTQCSKLNKVSKETLKTAKCLCATIAWFPVHSAKCPKKGLTETKKVDFVPVSTPVVRLSPLSANADPSDYECPLGGDEKIEEILTEIYVEAFEKGL